MRHHITATRNRTVFTGSQSRLFDLEDFGELREVLRRVPIPHGVTTSRRAALKYCRALARAIAHTRPDKSACADDVTHALVILEIDCAIGKAASAIFTDGKWAKANRLQYSNRKTNGMRLINWWVWVGNSTPEQLELFEPVHFYVRARGGVHGPN